MSAFGGETDIEAKLLTKDEALRIAASVAKLPAFPLCYACRTSREKFVMHTLTKFGFTLAQLLVGDTFWRLRPDRICTSAAAALHPRTFSTKRHSGT